MNRAWPSWRRGRCPRRPHEVPLQEQERPRGEDDGDDEGREERSPSSPSRGSVSGRPPASGDGAGEVRGGPDREAEDEQKDPEVEEDRGHELQGTEVDGLGAGRRDVGQDGLTEQRAATRRRRGPRATRRRRSPSAYLTAGNRFASSWPKAMYRSSTPRAATIPAEKPSPVWTKPLTRIGRGDERTWEGTARGDHLASRPAPPAASTRSSPAARCLAAGLAVSRPRAGSRPREGRGLSTVISPRVSSARKSARSPSPRSWRGHAGRAARAPRRRSARRAPARARPRPRRRRRRRQPRNTKILRPVPTSGSSAWRCRTS